MQSFKFKLFNFYHISKNRRINQLKFMFQDKCQGDECNNRNNSTIPPSIEGSISPGDGALEEDTKTSGIGGAPRKRISGFACASDKRYDKRKKSCVSSATAA
jgi:hypothetical protein